MYKEYISYVEMVCVSNDANLDQYELNIEYLLIEQSIVTNETENFDILFELYFK